MYRLRSTKLFQTQAFTNSSIPHKLKAWQALGLEICRPSKAFKRALQDLGVLEEVVKAGSPLRDWDVLQSGSQGSEALAGTQAQTSKKKFWPSQARMLVSSALASFGFMGLRLTGFGFRVYVGVLVVIFTRAGVRLCGV